MQLLKKLEQGAIQGFHECYRSRLWSMGPLPNFHSLLFIPIYDDLPNISQIGACEKILKKGLALSTELFSQFLFFAYNNRQHTSSNFIDKFQISSKNIVSFKCYGLLNFFSQVLFSKKISKGHNFGTRRYFLTKFKICP